MNTNPIPPVEVEGPNSFITRFEPKTGPFAGWGFEMEGRTQDFHPAGQFYPGYESIYGYGDTHVITVNYHGDRIGKSPSYIYLELNNYRSPNIQLVICDFPNLLIKDSSGQVVLAYKKVDERVEYTTDLNGGPFRGKSDQENIFFFFA